MAGRHLNIKGAFLHMVADAAVSGGVVAAGFAVIFSGFAWIDPAVSLVIAAIIVAGTWGLLRESLHLAVDGVPRDVDIGGVRAYLKTLPGVTGVHDLHVWGVSTNQALLTAHLEVGAETDQETVLEQASAGLSHEFGIGHTTLQIERDPNCPANEICPPKEDQNPVRPEA